MAKRRRFTPEFKGEVVLELRGEVTTSVQTKSRSQQVVENIATL